MRLLAKSEIDKAKASERRQEIDEGIKVARKVDTLRETAAQEEANLKTVREQSARRLKEEIQPLIAQKESLLSEIHLLEEQKKVAQIPLDTEWEKLRQKKVVVDDKEARLDSIRSELAQKQSELLMLEQEIQVKMDRANDWDHTATMKAAEADNTLVHAREEAADMRNKAQAVFSMVEARQREIDSREAKLAARERDVTMGIDRNAKYELHLITWEKQLRDREQTLARNIQRHDQRS